jgi:hypothetical protein
MTEQNYNANEETLDSLDETLDDLAELPAVVPFPSGAYLANMVAKRNAKKPGSYIVEFTYKETIELGDPTGDQQPPKEGDKSTVFITTKKKDGTVNEFGQGVLRKILSPVGEMLGTRSIGDILDATAKGIDVIAVLKYKKSADANYQDSQDVVSIQIPQ